MDVFPGEARFEELVRYWERDGRPMQAFTYQGFKWQAWIEKGVPVRFQQLGQVGIYKDTKGSFPGG